MKLLKIATFNTNSIRTRLSLVLDWLDSERPDVLCLQETKVQDKDFPADPFAEIGYSVIFKGQKSYNGVAIVSAHPIESVNRGLYGEADEQARFIAGNILQIPVINAYVPQGSAVGSEKFEYKLKWLKDLLSFIKKNHDPERPLLLLGDFNVALEAMDVFDPEKFQGEVGCHPDERAIIREFLDWGVVDIFREHQPSGGHYTFWDYRIPNAFKRKMGWRIDFIFATRPLAEKSRNVWIDTEPRTRQKPSDHTFLVAEFELPK